jgi:hypothetical protein
LRSSRCFAPRRTSCRWSAARPQFASRRRTPAAPPTRLRTPSAPPSTAAARAAAWAAAWPGFAPARPAWVRKPPPRLHALRLPHPRPRRHTHMHSAPVLPDAPRPNPSQFISGSHFHLLPLPSPPRAQAISSTCSKTGSRRMCGDSSANESRAKSSSIWYVKGPTCAKVSIFFVRRPKRPVYSTECASCFSFTICNSQEFRRACFLFFLARQICVPPLPH